MPDRPVLADPPPPALTGPSADAPAPVARLRWYVDRVRSMPRRELPFRLAEQARRLAGRTTARLPVAGPRRDTGLGALVLAWGARPEVLDFWRERVAAVDAGEIRVFGIPWATSADGLPDWQADPRTGYRWPDRYCFDVGFRARGEDGSDARYVWELHRLQYLLPVAAYAAVTGDGETADLCRRHLDSWLAENPPRRGIAWRSGIELGIRSLTLIVLQELLAAAGAPREALEGRLARSVAEHADWIARFPSRYSSANNHRVAELAGLVVTAAAYPALATPAQLCRWWDELDAEAIRQLHPDGVPAEQSTSYGALVTEWLALAAAAGRPLALRFSDRTLERIAAVADFLAVLTDTAGHTVRIGDDDESRLLTAACPAADYYGAVTGLAEAVVTTSFAGTPTAHGPRPGVTVFPDGGYTVARTPEAGGESLWVLDHGPLGFDRLAAHAHADTLAVHLHHAGRPVFVDAGTYLYHGAGAWRRYLRGTASHNTLVVGDADSSVMTGPFNWDLTDRARGRLGLLDAAPEHWSVEAEHDGYLGRHGVVHRRTLSRTGSGRYLLSDVLLGGPAVRVDWSLLVSPELRVLPAAGGWVVLDGDEPLVRLTVPAGWHRALYRGSGEPVAGWCSPAFGRLVPAYQLHLDGVLGPDRPLDVEITLLGAARDIPARWRRL